MLGFIASQVHGDSYRGYNKLGVTGGLYVNAQLSKPGKKGTSAELGVIFTQKGAKHNKNPQKNDYRYYYLNLNYIEVPLILRYHNNGFFYTLGVSAAYLINYYEGSEVGNLTGIYPFQNMDYSCSLGIGTTLSKNMTMELRSSNSFITIRPFNLPPNVYYNTFIGRTFNNGMYNNILVFSLYYKINLKQKSAEPKT